MYDEVVLDIGGTFVKYGLIQGEQFYLKGQFPIQESGTKEKILSPIREFLKVHIAPKIVICMPGPMDYTMGISRMDHKFRAIKNFPIKAWLENQFPDVQIIFLHDGVSFMLGEMTVGALQKTGCGAGIMLGTGLGFGICKNKKMLIGPEATPAYSLWSLPWKDGICEQYVSGRALRKIWESRTGQTMDICEIAELAYSGDRNAKKLFSEAGQNLGMMVNMHLKDRSVERIVVGGQIAKSWSLFECSYKQECYIPTSVSNHLDDATLWGNLAYASYGDTLTEVIL